jgi:DMSO/TMAO reductase YedYZ heme-binding membrane subunit
VIVALGAIDSRAYWYLTRATGAVTLVLLTVVVVLGVLGSLRFAAAPRWPRFAIDTMHRDISLLVIALLVLHVIVSVLDGFAPIRLTDAVIPFIGLYRPLWIGFGALSFDLLIALVITSLVRRRLGYRAWRAIHWLAYVSWPVAILHGLGSGSDTKQVWMLGLTIACVFAVAVACCYRIAGDRAVPDGLRTPGLALAVLTPLGLAIFTLLGPLQTGWARRAGTPVRLLASTGTPVTPRTTAAARRSTAPRSTSTQPRAPAASATTTARVTPFSTQLAGTLKQTAAPGGTILDLALRLTGPRRGRLRVRLAGAPLGGGGLSLTGSQVDLVASGLPSVMSGQILQLQGEQFVARVRDRAGNSLDLDANLQIDNQSGAVTGTLSATRPGGGP